MNSPNQPPQGGVAAMLASLNKDVTTNVAQLNPRAPEVNLEQKILDIQQKLEETNEIADPQKREEARGILTATLEDVRKTQQKDQDDLAEMVLGLDVLMKDVGEGLQNLLKPSAQEEAMVADAKSRIKTAEASLAEANSRTGLKAMFGKSAAIQAAAAELEQAQVALPQVEAAAAKMARKRLREGNLEQNMQVFMSMCQNIVIAMTNRNQATGAQLRIARARLDEAQAIKQQAAALLQTLDEKLAGLELDLRKEEDLLQEYTNGTLEYAAQDKKIIDLRAEVETVRGEKNTGLVVYQSKEKFVAILEGHLTATRRIFENQRTWLAKLQSDAEERQVTYVNQLATMQAMADLEVANSADQAGNEMDRRGAIYMAQAAGAADSIRMKMVEKQPEIMRELAEIHADQAKHMALIREREKEVYERFQKKYDIDPLSSSFLGIDRAEAAEAQKAAA